MLKRGFDLILSAAIIVVIFPIFFFIAFLIKFDSTGPVLFRQTRVGRHCHPFKIHKFRTMVVNASEIGPSITTFDDPRITKVGRFLRKYKLDELPQLFDVLRGEMSFVGPRPEVPKYVDLYDDNDKEVIFSVRPGITDEASIKFRKESELIENSPDADSIYVDEILPIKLSFHRHYVENRSLWMDVKIVCKTVWLLLAFKLKN